MLGGEVASKYHFQGISANKVAQKINHVIWARFRAARRSLVGWLGRCTIAHETFLGLLDHQPARQVVMWMHERNSVMRCIVDRYLDVVRKKGVHALSELYSIWQEIDFAPMTIHHIAYRARKVYHEAMVKGECNMTFLDTSLNTWGGNVEEYYGHLRLAEEDIVKYNQKLVWAVVRDSRIDMDESNDAMQEGFLTLIEAMYRYDPSEGMTFGAYAYQWVFTRIMRYIKQKKEPTQEQMPDAGAMAASPVEEGMIEEGVSPEMFAERMSDTEIVRSIVARLEEPYREMAMLFLDAGSDKEFWQTAIRKWGGNAKSIYDQMLALVRMHFP